jgi:hypothetical protein
MPIAIPFSIWLSARETEAPHLPIEETLRRISCAFPEAVIDWERGKQYRLGRIDELTSMGCPEVILLGDRHIVDKTVYVGISFPGWPGNPVYTYVTPLNVHLDGLIAEADHYDIELLKYAGRALSQALNFRFWLGTGHVGTLDTQVRPGKHDPQQFVCEFVYGGNEPPPDQMPVLRELPDWKRSLHRAVVLYLSQYEQRKLIAELTQGFASYEEFASAVLAVLDAISPVQKCWSLDYDAPFGNSALLDHGDWMTHISLSGVPRGILT